MPARKHRVDEAKRMLRVSGGVIEFRNVEDPWAFKRILAHLLSSGLPDCVAAYRRGRDDLLGRGLIEE
jgi:hypothetical protein